MRVCAGVNARGLRACAAASAGGGGGAGGRGAPVGREGVKGHGSPATRLRQT